MNNLSSLNNLNAKKMYSMISFTSTALLTLMCALHGMCTKEGDRWLQVF